MNIKKGDVTAYMMLSKDNVKMPTYVKIVGHDYDTGDWVSQIDEHSFISRPPSFYFETAEECRAAHLNGKRHLYKTAYSETYGYVTLLGYNKCENGEYCWRCSSTILGRGHLMESTLSKWGL